MFDLIKDILLAIVITAAIVAFLVIVTIAYTKVTEGPETSLGRAMRYTREIKDPSRRDPNAPARAFYDQDIISWDKYSDTIGVMTVIADKNDIIVELAEEGDSDFNTFYESFASSEISMNKSSKPLKKLCGLDYLVDDEWLATFKYMFSREISKHGLPTKGWNIVKWELRSDCKLKVYLVKDNLLFTAGVSIKDSFTFDSSIEVIENVSLGFW